jgi:hypothetical protein
MAAVSLFPGGASDGRQKLARKHARFLKLQKERGAETNRRSGPLR